MKPLRMSSIGRGLFALFLCAICIPALHANNSVLGEVELEGASKVEKTSGVWVDGQYVGYLRELKGSKKLLLLPGEHDITVRQAGYLDFHQRIVASAGKKQTVQVKMERDNRVALPKVTAQIKLDVRPDRAAVFVDGVYVGHISEFEGLGRGMLVSPGKHHITISLPGYQNFDTEIDLVAKQKSEIKTDLAKGGPVEGPSLSPAR